MTNHPDDSLTKDNCDTVVIDRDVYERDEVIQLINSVLAKAIHKKDAHDAGIFKEISALKGVIQDTRAEIGKLGAGDINQRHIPTATDELDAVVGATEDATGAIMDSCEAIQACLVEQMPDKKAIEGQVIKIFEACTFQDITGQRISKVVGTLKDIDAKVRHILAMLGHDVDASSEEGDADRQEEKRRNDDDSALLNGPQMPDDVPTQADIDKLLADFD